MSNHNAETLTLTQINQKGTIVEPRRTLTFPIPENIQDWTRIRFGLAVSYTDLNDPEALLGVQTSNHLSTDGTVATWPWFGLTSSSGGNLPLVFGGNDVYVGLGGDQANYMIGGIYYRGSSDGEFRVNPDIVSSSPRPISILGNSVLSSPTNFTQCRPFNGKDPQEETHTQLWVLEAEISDKGGSTQSMRFYHNLDEDTNLAYGDFTEPNLVSAVSSALSDGSTPILHDGGVPLDIPQNIIFHWPFYDIWRIRLHGAVLIKKA